MIPLFQHRSRLPDMLRRGWPCAVLVVLLGLLAVPRTAYGQANEHALKTAYLYKFTHYVQWPNGVNQPFVIGVFGESPLERQMEKLAQLKKVGNRPIVIRRLVQPVDAQQCQMVFLAESTNAQVQSAVIQATSGRPVLVVGETPGLAKQGAAINFFLDETDGTLGFAINVTAMQARGFKADPKLLKLAEIVQ